MSETVQRKVTKSRKWIDYSSDEENDHPHEQKAQQTTKDNTHNHQKQEPITTKGQKLNNLPILSSHEPVKQHLIEDRKEQLKMLRQVKGNSVWIELSIKDITNLSYLKESISTLKELKNQQIFSIYTSRENELAFDLKIHVDLCEKWIVEGYDSKKIIRLDLLKKLTKQRDQKPEVKRRDYLPIKHTHSQHTAQTRLQPKSPNIVEEQQKQQPKKKYVQKNPLAEKLQKRVEEQIAQKLLHKKDKPKKEKGSKFYSKNPFDALGDSD